MLPCSHRFERLYLEEQRLSGGIEGNATMKSGDWRRSQGLGKAEGGKHGSKGSEANPSNFADRSPSNSQSRHVSPGMIEAKSNDNQAQSLD